MQALIELSEKSVSISRNDYLTMPGRVDQNAYYVDTGSLRVFVDDGEDEQIIRFGYEGNLVVPLDSYLTGKPSNLYIQAIRKSTIRIITREQIDDFLRDAAHTTFWIGILENLIVQQMEREIDILTSSPRERYQRVLARSPQLFQEVPHKYIASYLRMSPETLSRLQKS